MIAQTQNKPGPTRQQPLAGRLREVARQYQETLVKNPRHAEALAGMSLVALASRQNDAAIRMAQVAVSVAPKMGTAWVILGQALRAAGRAQEARQAYEAALHLDGKSTMAHTGLGELKIASGEPQAALENFEFALQEDFALTAARLGMGHALACLDRFEEALTHYEAVLAKHERLPEAEFAVGFALQKLNKPHAAEQHYRRALELRPDFAAGWMNLALLMREMSRMDEAETCLRRALTLDPERVETHVAWVQFHVARRDLVQAREWLTKAQAQDADHAEAMNMAGILLHHEERFEEAVAAFDRAEALGSKQAASNRGNSLMELSCMRDALEAHRRAAEMNPLHAGTRYNLALAQLRMGEWAEAWANYEARWSFREVHRKPRVFRRPRWRGEVLRGERVLLHAEQGLGDAIQFCRYAELVAQWGGFPILQVREPVERLMRTLRIVRTGQAETARLGSEPPAFDLECPLMSLPAVFGTTVDSVPWRGAYLSADPDDVEALTAPFPDGDCGYLRVGVAWAGNPKYKADARRSTHLKTLLPLLTMPEIEWVSLQKGEAAQQLAELPAGIRITDGASADRDLADAATLIATLDLVITTDTSIAHLAGALGKPVWILLPHHADWRWMHEIGTTPWYPTARLMRQARPGDWAGVLERVKAELAGLA